MRLCAGQRQREFRNWISRGGAWREGAQFRLRRGSDTALPQTQRLACEGRKVGWYFVARLLFAAQLVGVLHSSRRILDDRCDVM